MKILKQLLSVKMNYENEHIGLETYEY